MLYCIDLGKTCLLLWVSMQPRRSYLGPLLEGLNYGLNCDAKLHKGTEKVTYEYALNKSPLCVPNFNAHGDPFILMRLEHFWICNIISNSAGFTIKKIHVNC